MNLDLDGDGLTDRVWRENIENRSRADYRIDFGNGDVAELYGMGGGIPQVRTLDVNGDGQEEILFTLSYGYSADPRAFGENALIMKGEDGVYKPVALPESMVPMDTGAAGGSGVREGYQWSLLLEGVPAGETSLKLTCVNSSDGAGLEVVKSYTKEEWEAVNDSVFASKAEFLLETPAYQADIERDVLSGKDILKLYYSALGKESSDEVILTLEYEDGRMRMNRLQYLEYYREKVPITIGEKEYELWIDGHGLTDSGYYEIDFIALVDPENPGGYADTIIPEEVSRISWQTPEGEEAYPVQSTSRDGGILVADLNFDGFEDLCFQGWVTAGANVPYYCMLWNRSNQEFEYSATLCNVDTDAEERWISSWSRVGWDQYYTAYYRYDEDNRLHLVRYVEENFSEDEVFEKLDLTYVEDDGVYSLPMIWENSYDIHDGEMCWKMIAMAKQALEELYLWTGDKVDTVCFKVTKIGCVYFATSPENMGHARIFSSRYFGADTEYNLSNSETSISGISMISEREVWYSPVSWRIYPEELSAMSDEDIIVWYFERVHAGEGDKVETITERRYEDVRAVWVIQTEGGDWYEVVYNAELREISDITGPYSSCPEH